MTEYQGRKFLRSQIGMQCSMTTNAAMHQGECTRGLDMCIFLASAVGSPNLLKLFACVVSLSHIPCMCINPMCDV